ncbi:hypothetical protein GLE_2386 [Lysobacter enzymogenes]|uniref:Uncharacterized protein n=1 Tax=Lysobacter enzymogenes TaxID=69 RepID=A0A0S2DGI0_LYSEN|nr:hypothetical protein GLE_2386 [Lysobacter enzymogenes]
MSAARVRPLRASIAAVRSLQAGSAVPARTVRDRSAARRSSCGRGFSPDAFRSGRRARIQKRRG